VAVGVAPSADGLMAQSVAEARAAVQRETSSLVEQSVAERRRAKGGGNKKKHRMLEPGCIRMVRITHMPLRQKGFYSCGQQEETHNARTRVYPDGSHGTCATAPRGILRVRTCMSIHI